MEQQGNTAGKTKKGVIAVIIAIILLAAGAYASFTIMSDDGPDIEEGDVVSDIDPLTGVPHSGTWSFQLDIGNPGTAQVNVAPDGSYLTLNADGQNLFFYTTSSVPPYTYRTNDMWFMLKDSIDLTVDGYAYYEFTAVDSDVIDGFVHHDTYPAGGASRAFHMELIELELPDMSWYDLSSGDWEINWDPEGESECEDGPVTFSSLPDAFTLDNSVDTSGDVASGDMSMDFGGGEVFDLTPGSTNAHAGGGAIDPGVITDSAGDASFDYVDDSFDADVTAFGTSDTTMEGYIDMTGSESGCGFTLGFSATYIGS